jgi:predicted O-linked N-acetylglucosamine transferase (SPINDLY family)
MFSFFKKSVPTGSAEAAPLSGPDALAQADACIDAAFAHEDAQQWDAALAAYRQALELVPDYWRAHVNLGNALKARGQLDAAHQHYQSAYAQNPDVHGTCYNLGADWVRLGRMAEAIPLLQRAIDLKPDFADAMVLLAEALAATGLPVQGVAWLKRAVTVQPDNLGALVNLLEEQEKLGCYEEGEQTARLLSALMTRHGDGGWDFPAEFARRHGEMARAIALYQAIPESAFTLKTYSNYLMNLAYLPGIDPVWLLGEHRKFNRFVDTAHPLALPPVKRKVPRRIGFVSPDLRGHPVADFVVGLFEQLDRTQFEVYAYSATEKPDAMTERLQRATDGWREIRSMDARAAAALIASDQIDILIDLAGHTAGARLDVIALKPAPVTATWLGYPATTGMDGVDFRIVDGYTDPPGMTEVHHSEHLLRLPYAQWCYTHWRGFLPVSDLPALTRGYVTFASFGMRAKLSDTTLQRWAQLMQRVPGSRMLIANIRAGHDHNRVVRLFEAEGISADRLDFVQRTPSYQDYSERYRQVDVVLDTHPYTGCTTICDAMYMGVPALTIAGGASVSRCAASLLTHVGLPEWVCDSPEAFVEQGARLVADLPALARTRAGLRECFMASPVGDQERFARDFGALLHQMWQLKGLAQV